MNHVRHLSITAAWLAGLLSFAAWGHSDDGFDERAKGSGTPAVVFARFTPSILRFDRTTPFTLTAKIGNGVADRVVLTQENGSETAMRDDGTQGDAVAGDGVYTVQLPAALAVSGLQADDVYRKFIGYIDAYVGTSRASRYNTFASIWGAEMGVVNVVTASATAHYSNYVLNIVDPTSFAAGPGDFQPVVSKLYQVLPDQFDFVDVVFDGIHVGNRYHFAVRNDVSGLGMAISNSGSQYGSASRLKGISAFPVNNIFDTVDPGHSHEIGHQWINFLKQAQLATGKPHWPYSTLASGTMGFSIPGSLAGGEYRCVLTPVDGGLQALVRTQPKVFKDLDLYLMGLLPANQVATHYVFKDQVAAASTSCMGTLPYSLFNAISINDIIASDGPRSPAYPNAQKDFKVAVLVVSDAKLSPEAMAHYHWFAKRAEATELVATHLGFTKESSAPWYLQTGQRSTLNSRLRDGAGAGTFVTVFEFFAPSLNHYFRTANADEAAWLSANPSLGWNPTGKNFKAYARHDHPSTVKPVCRFYGSVSPGPNSHFFTADAGECAWLKQIQAQTPAGQPRWNYEEIAFAIDVHANGSCPASAPVPIYRVYNNRAAQNDSNHRYATDTTVYQQMIGQGWKGEGVVMCAPS